MWGHKHILTSLLFIEMPVPSQESERRVCVDYILILLYCFVFLLWLHSLRHGIVMFQPILDFLPVSKARRNKLHIFRLCSYFTWYGVETKKYYKYIFCIYQAKRIHQRVHRLNWCLYNIKWVVFKFYWWHYMRLTKVVFGWTYG